MKSKTERERPTNAIFVDGSSKHSTPLAIHPEAIGVSYPTRVIRDRESYKLREVVTADVAEIANGVAVISVDGPLEHKGGGGWWSFWQNYEDLACDFNLVVNDPAIKAVVLKFDSPGGECAGLNETVAIMQGMKADAGKPVIAYVDEACYSAAYALAMVADEIYLPESGGVGSIGVITAMCDVTKLNEKQGVRVEVIASGSKKTDGHPAVALTEGAIKRTRRTVDKLAASFFDLVSAGRGLSTEVIRGFEAGTFTGQDAVDAGLADGVMSLHDCLTFTTNEFSSFNSPTEQSEEKDPDTMPGKIAAAKALNDAEKALASANATLVGAKTDADRALAAARVLAAEDVVAKVKKTKTVTTDTHEEEVDDGEEEAKDPPPSDDDDDGDEEEDDDDDGDGKAAASASASIGEHTTKGLLALARRITGKKSIDEVMGALHATWQSSKKTKTLAAEVASLKADAERSKVSALIERGMKAGKLAPTQRAWAKTQTPASLKAYLDAAPKMVHTVDDENTEARVEGLGAATAGVVTAEMARIWRKLGHAEKDFPALLAKMNGTATPSTTNGAS